MLIKEKHMKTVITGREQIIHKTFSINRSTTRTKLFDSALSYLNRFITQSPYYITGGALNISIIHRSSVQLFFSWNLFDYK